MIVAHAVIVLAISVRVIMRRPATGVALAWLFLVATVPLLGGGLYLLVGERRISQRRALRIAALRTGYDLLSEAVIAKGGNLA